jgi:hypothetical protein
VNPGVGTCANSSSRYSRRSLHVSIKNQFPYSLC